LLPGVYSDSELCARICLITWSMGRLSDSDHDMDRIEGGDRAADYQSQEPLKGGEPRRSQGCMLVTAFLLPFLSFALIVAVFITLFHAEPMLLGAAVLFCLFLATALLLPTTRRLLLGGEPRDSRDTTPWQLIGLLIIFSVLAAVAAGGYIDQTLLIEHSAFHERRIYNNVLPQTPALSYLDAGIVKFSQDAHLEEPHALGYAAGKNRYCVVPIVGTEAAKVEYWAAGINCCEQRGAFRCGSPGNKAGLVYSELEVHEELLHHFSLAAREAGAAFGMQISKDPLFVRLVGNPEKEVEQIYRDAALLGAIFIGAFFMFSMAAGWVVKTVASNR